ncbi:MAG: DUF998 domain-containing protein [Galactobacter sp.]
MTARAPSRTRARTGAVLLGINALVYLVAEALAALAWRDPTYSYSYNYISDLGVPDVDSFEGRVIDSPLHWIMNTGFVLHGVLFIVAVLLLRGMFTGTVTRRVIVALAFLHGIGIALVGLFHGSQQAVEDGTAVLHGTGALLAIIAGNAAFILAGTALLRRSMNVSVPPRRRWPGGVFIALGVSGIASFTSLLATAGSNYDGIPERIAVYTVMVAELIAATALLITNRTPTGTPESMPARTAR